MTKWIDRIVYFLAAVAFAAKLFAQSPEVAVAVANANVKAALQDQPILPDDFGRASRDIAATWSESTPKEAGTVEEVVPNVTLYTGDGTWCPYCVQQNKLLKDAGAIDDDGNPVWPFRIVKCAPDDPRIEGGVPRWEVDDDDSKTLSGIRECVSLKKWIYGYAKKSTKQVAANYPVEWVVEVDGNDSKAIVLALAEACRRQDDTLQVAQGFLPAIPIDVDDDLLKVLDALMSSDGYTREGLRVGWPVGKRTVTFDPGIQVRFRKVVEVDATVTAIEMNGREVSLSLAGTIVSQLTVRLK
jgi:glutaredoxin